MPDAVDSVYYRFFAFRAFPHCLPCGSRFMWNLYYHAASCHCWVLTLLPLPFRCLPSYAVYFASSPPCLPSTFCRFTAGYACLTLLLRLQNHLVTVLVDGISALPAVAFSAAASCGITFYVVGRYCGFCIPALGSRVCIAMLPFRRTWTVLNAPSPIYQRTVCGRTTAYHYAAYWTPFKNVWCRHFCALWLPLRHLISTSSSLCGSFTDRQRRLGLRVSGSLVCSAALTQDALFACHAFFAGLVLLYVPAADVLLLPFLLRVCCCCSVRSLCLAGSVLHYRLRFWFSFSPVACLPRLHGLPSSPTTQHGPFGSGLRTWLPPPLRVLLPLAYCLFVGFVLVYCLVRATWHCGFPCLSCADVFALLYAGSCFSPYLSVSPCAVCRLHGSASDDLGLLHGLDETGFAVRACTFAHPVAVWFYYCA